MTLATYFVIKGGARYSSTSSKIVLSPMSWHKVFLRYSILSKVSDCLQITFSELIDIILSQVIKSRVKIKIQHSRFWCDLQSDLIMSEKLKNGPILLNFEPNAPHYWFRNYTHQDLSLFFLPIILLIQSYHFWLLISDFLDLIVGWFGQQL